MIWATLLAAGGVGGVVVSMALGRAAATAEGDGARDAAELLAMRALVDDREARDRVAERTGELPTGQPAAAERQLH